MKKYLRILYIIPASFIVTALYWAYRYVWFSVETMPEGRVKALTMVTLFLSSLFLIELIDDKDKSND